MSFTFPPNTTKLIVPVMVFGPRQSQELKCTIDTGSGVTVLSATFLQQIGVDLSRPVECARLRGITGYIRVPVVRVAVITALDRVRTEFLVAAHDFPLGTEADGVIGLDFFRGYILNLDFIRGRITLAARRWWQFWR